LTVNFVIFIKEKQGATMGRRKIDTTLKLPEGKIKSTFMKRKQGAVNKAKQLGKLCDVDVALIAFHPHNDAVIAVSHGGRIDEIISKFQDFKEQHLGKIEIIEELRNQPRQLQAHQMHPNTQVPPHLPPPTLEVIFLVLPAIFFLIPTSNRFF